MFDLEQCPLLVSRSGVATYYTHRQKGSHYSGVALPEFCLGYLGELKRLLLRIHRIAPAMSVLEWEHLLNFRNIGG